MQLGQLFTSSVRGFLLLAEAPRCSSSSLFLLGESFYGPIGVDALCCCLKCYFVVISQLTWPKVTKDKLDCPKSNTRVRL